MIKKILTSKLTYLILIVLVNVTVLVSFCLYLNEKFEYPSDYVIPNTSEKNDTLMTKYCTVKRGDLVSKQNYDSSIEEYDTMYSEYMLDICFIEELTSITKGQVIGTNSGVEITSLFDGFCIDVNESSSGVKIVIYNYNQFSIKVELSVNDYIKDEFLRDKEYSLSFGLIKKKAYFVGYDLSDLKNSQKVYGIFKTDSCDLLVTDNTLCNIESILDYSNDCTFIDSNIFDGYYSYESFYIYDGKNVQEIKIKPIKFIDSYAIIDSGLVEEGTVLYVK